jgi:hypothetical protein
MGEGSGGSVRPAINFGTLLVVPFKYSHQVYTVDSQSLASFYLLEDIFESGIFVNSLIGIERVNLNLVD